MAIMIGRRFIYGIVNDKPMLPKGWEYVEAEGEWLRAKSPKGGMYYVEDGTEIVKFWPEKTAGLWDFIRTRGRLKIGRKFLDDSHGFGIPRDPFKKTDR